MNTSFLTSLLRALVSIGTTLLVPSFLSPASVPIGTTLLVPAGTTLLVPACPAHVLQIVNKLIAIDTRLIVF